MSHSHKNKPNPKSDFYTENGFVVFTADFHKKRGYCCGSVCRHCPFTPKHIAYGKQLDEEVIPPLPEI
ncbi:MAG: DUF5522 domain-containing protein [Bacteroidetes bacterium]|nr:DUF5522 domain-containing protein [Bacteroidota bacterium]